MGEIYVNKSTKEDDIALPDIETSPYKNSNSTATNNFEESIFKYEIITITAPSSSTTGTTRIGYNRSETIFTYVHVATFAIIGCIIRIGIDQLMGAEIIGVEDSASIIFQSFFSNMFGSFVLGLLTASSLKGRPGMLPLYTGLSTGLCGSITTFSKFNQQVSEMIVGETNTIGNRYFTAFASIVLGISAPICSFKFGEDITSEMRRRFFSNDSETQTTICCNVKFAKYFNHLSYVFLLVSWITLLIIAIIYSQNQTVLFLCLCCVMAPFGATIRFILSRLNAKPQKCLIFKTLKKVPLGTFCANLIGSIGIALVSVILTWANLSCAGVCIFKAVQTGFLACLTTVSTFTSEICKLRLTNIVTSHLYAFITIVSCQTFACIINGVSLSVYISSAPGFNNTSCS